MIACLSLGFLLLGLSAALFFFVFSRCFFETPLVPNLGHFVDQSDEPVVQVVLDAVFAGDVLEMR